MFFIIVYLINVGNTAELNQRETTLLSILLSMFSLFISWLLTHYYSESQNKQAIEEVKTEYSSKLKTYAENAAEKVTNLSALLNNLSKYLQDELESNEYETNEEILISREERIASAVHMLNALKSVNDTALSDWKGIIGDLIDKKIREKEKREEEQEKILHDTINALYHIQDKTQGTNESEIHILLDEVKDTLSQIKLNANISTKRQKRKSNIESACPVCKEKIIVRQNDRPRTCKTSICKKCNTKLVSIIDANNQHSIQERKSQPELVTCPHCKDKIEITLDNAFPTSTIEECPQCGNKIVAIRQFNNIEIREVKKEKITDIDEKLLDMVRKSLPEQPWEHKIHSKIAKQLNIHDHIAQKCIHELIRRGIFHIQFDGKLYDKDSPTTPKKLDSE